MQKAHKVNKDFFFLVEKDKMELIHSFHYVTVNFGTWKKKQHIWLSCLRSLERDRSEHSRCVSVCSCFVCWGKQVSVRSNWCLFQEAWGGPLGCRGTKFGLAHVTQISCLCFVLSVSFLGTVSLLESTGLSFKDYLKLFWFKTFLLTLFLLWSQNFQVSVAGIRALWLSECNNWRWRSSAPLCCF